MVTVALACWSSSETGLPTMLLRPITTACAPSSSTPCSFEHGHHAERRTGDSFGRRRAAGVRKLSGCSASASLAGSIASATASGEMCFGQRQLHEDAVDAVVAG